MTLDDLIDRLARQYGLGDAYHDYRGELKIISRSTKQAILAAMGCSVDDAAGIEAALARQESQRWETLLPPVAVVTPAGRFVTLAVAADAWDCGLDWQIDLEQGGRRSGSARVGDLAEFERADVQGRTQTRRRLDLPDDLPNGYHALRVAIRGATTGHCALIAAPQACFEPQLLREGRRLWGVAVQLYTLRSSTNWGIGDFADLEAVVRVCAPAGASFIGLNPLHALFPSEPRQFSPYSASSRHFLNVLYIAVERVPEYPECDEVLELVSSVSFQAELRFVLGRPLYPAIVAGLL